MKSKGWSVRGSHGKLLTDRSLRTQTENLANLSTRKGASMDLSTFQKSGFKDLDTFWHAAPDAKRRIPGPTDGPTTSATKCVTS